MGGSSPDENVPEKGSGWSGRGCPLLVGSSYTVREVCDGQSLASPGRWAVEDRRYPENPVWSELARRSLDYAQKAGTPELLTSLALGKVSPCPFPHSEIDELKRGVVDYLRTEGFLLERRPEDRTEVPIDFRYLALLLRASGDPEISLGDFSRGVRVGPGVRLPRLPALYQRKRKWRLPDQDDRTAYLESDIVGDSLWRQNYSSIKEHVSRVLAVLDDQSSRGQALKMSESQARLRYPHLVVASLGAMRKEQPGGVISARVFFDGANGLPVNRRIRPRDQERSRVASDLKRFMRENARRGEPTFSLTADVT